MTLKCRFEIDESSDPMEFCQKLFIELQRIQDSPPVALTVYEEEIRPPNDGVTEVTAHFDFNSSEDPYQILGQTTLAIQEACDEPDGTLSDFVVFHWRWERPAEGGVSS